MHVIDKKYFHNKIPSFKSSFKEVVVMPMTKKERDELRPKIVKYCETPKTPQQVAKRFEISTISAAAFLSGLRHGICEYDYDSGTYVTKK